MSVGLIGIYVICTILTTTSIIFSESSRRKRGNPKVHENSNKVVRAYLNIKGLYNFLTLPNDTNYYQNCQEQLQIFKM